MMMIFFKPTNPRKKDELEEKYNKYIIIMIQNYVLLSSLTSNISYSQNVKYEQIFVPNENVLFFNARVLK